MKLFRIAAAGTLAALATACLLTPGAFNASLDLRRDGSFTYRYTGEVVFITPAAAAAAEGEKSSAFDPEAQECFEDATGMDDVELDSKSRDCTKEEIEQARTEWQAAQATAGEQRKIENERMKAMFGGVDPSDPKAVEQFTQRLMTYDGWKRVTHKGKGVFDVLYEKSGRIDHDFVFPVFPEVDWIIPFVQVSRRTDGRVRVAAPAFVQPQGMGSLMGGSAMGAMGGGDRDMPLPKPEGTFTLTTDAEILTNNTNDGPSAGPGGGKSLRWTVGPLDAKKPEALLKL